ncbi:hypothetical protein K438DRAFT_1965958 [Mycena galopus ATCC 62051]|nr:hypothetical protein K438DRAFT_1965958 [Mycena galopus ATCC 62051]
MPPKLGPCWEFFYKGSKQDQAKPRKNQFMCEALPMELLGAEESNEELDDGTLNGSGDNYNGIFHATKGPWQPPRDGIKGMIIVTSFSAHLDLPTMYYIVDPAQFASLCALMSNTLSIACTTLVLYGLYIVLFILAIRAITQRNPPRRRTLLAVTSVMFFLGTCDAVATVALIGITMKLFKEVVQESSDPLHLLWVLNVLRLAEIKTFSVVTDLIFLYRCYVIWDSRKKVLILPALCILATVVLMVVVCLQLYEGTYLIDPRAPFIMLLGTNLLLMFLTAGRIWYRGRGMHTILGPTFGKTYNSALALILESGAIYCFCAILLVASQTTQTAGEFGAIFYGISTGLATQTVNIAPTLILVRIGMDQDQIQQTTSVSDQLPSGRPIRFRAPVNLEDGSCPVVDFK